MTRHTPRRAAVLVLAALVLPGVSSAQTQAGLSAGYSVPSGTVYDNLDPSPTLGGYVVVGVTQNAQAGIALDYTPLKLAATRETVTQTDIMVAGRYRFPTSAEVRFFLGGKGGLGRHSASFSATDALGEPRTIEITAVGFAVGPSMGAQFGIGRLAFEISADFLFQSFGDRSANGVGREGTGANGFRVVPRAGLTIPGGG